MTFNMKPLSCDPARINGMSERLIVSHYENNYGGAVKRLNLIGEKLAELNYESTPGFLINAPKREQLIAMNSPFSVHVFCLGNCHRRLANSGDWRRASCSPVPFEVQQSRTDCGHSCRWLDCLSNPGTDLGNGQITIGYEVKPCTTY